MAPSVPVGALALACILADLDRQLSAEPVLVTRLSRDKLILLRREMFAVAFALMVLTSDDALLDSDVQELVQKLRLCIDHFASYSGEPQGASEEQRKAAAYRAVLGVSQIEPVAREICKTTPELKDVVFKWGAASTGTSILNERMEDLLKVSGGTAGPTLIPTILTRPAAIVADLQLTDLLAKYAVQAIEATREVASWLRRGRN